METKELQIIEPAGLPQNTMERLLVAVQSGMTAEMVEKFMDLAERQERREAEKAFHRAFAAFKANPPQIVKDKWVDYTTSAGKRTKYKHATIGSVVGAIIEGMSKYGLSHRWNTSQDGKNITVTCHITHEMGHTETTALSAGADESGGKNAIQAIASTVTYLERYTLQAATGIAVLETDDDGRGAEGITQPPGKQGKKPEQRQPNNEQSADKWQPYLDQWCAWIDKFTDATIDQFMDQWETQGGEKALQSMPEPYKAKMLIAKNEMVKHLTEKQGAR